MKKRRNIIAGVIAVLLIGGLYVATQTDLLVGTFGFQRIENTKTPEAILVEAKKEVGASMKSTVAEELQAQQDHAYKKFLALPKIFDEKLSFKIDLDGNGMTGNAEIVFDGKAEVGTEGIKTLDKDATLLQFIETFQGQFTLGLGIKSKQEIDIFDTKDTVEVEAKAAAKIIMNRGEIHMSLTAFELPKSPGPLPFDIEGTINEIKGKWYTINLNKILKDNNTLMTIAKSTKIFNANKEKITKVINAYVDQTLLTTDFFTVEEGSRKMTRHGDVYTLTVDKEKAKSIINAHHDFMVNNFDAIIAMSRSGFEDALPMYQEADALFKEEFVRDFGSFRDFLISIVEDDKEFEEVSIKGTFNGDKLAQLAFDRDFNITEGDDTGKGSIEMALNFEDGKHDLKKSHMVGEVDLETTTMMTDLETNKKRKTEEAKISAKMIIAKPKGSHRVTKGTFNAHSKSWNSYGPVSEEPWSDLVFAANGAMVLNPEDRTIESAEFEMDVVDNISKKSAADNPGSLYGMKGDFTYKGGNIKTISGSLDAKPKDKIGLVVKGTIKGGEGNVDAVIKNALEDFAPLKALTASYSYMVSTGEPDIFISPEIRNGTDLTDTIMGLLKEEAAQQLIP